MIKREFSIETPKVGVIRTFMVDDVKWYSLYDVSVVLGFSHSVNIENIPEGLAMMIITKSSQMSKTGNSRVNKRKDMYVVNAEGLLYVLLNLSPTFNSLKREVLLSCGVHAASLEEVLLEQTDSKTMEVNLNEKV